MGNRRFALACVFTGLLLMLAAPLTAQTIDVLTPASDRTSVDNAPTDGVADGLLADDDVFLRTFGNPAYFRSAIEFPGIPAGVQIVSATLYLYDGGSVTGGDTIEIHGYVGNGVVELGSDFAVDNLVSSYVNTSNGVGRNLDVTAFVQSLATAGDPVAGFMLRATVEGGFAGSDINSNEMGTEGPTLTIEYQLLSSIPTLGGTGIFIMVGLLALAGAIILSRRIF